MSAIEFLLDENKRLKSIINKARQYIEDNFDRSGINVSGSDLPFSYIEDLLLILNEVDKENK